MTLSRSFFTTTALGLSLVANTASADLSASDVWGDWRAYFEGLGYSVTATEVAAGGTLSVEDIVVQLGTGSDTDQFTMSVGALQFVETSDGRVEVVMPPQMPIVIDINSEESDQPDRVELVLTQIGQKMTVRGDAQAMDYDYGAESIGLALSSLLVDGTKMGPDAARMNVSGTDLRSQTSVRVADARSYVQNMEIGSMVYDIFVSEMDEIDTASIVSTMQNVAFKGTSTLPAARMPQDEELASMLAAGFSFDGAFSAKGTDTKVEVILPDGPTRIKTGSAASSLGIGMGADGIRYEMAAEQVQMGAEIAGLPFPLFAEMAKSGFSVRVPVLKSDDPQDFGLAFNATEFTISDIIWGLFDPSSELPRDPATIALDLSGKAKVLAPSFDPDAMLEMAETGTMPAELQALLIDRLTLDAVGAKIDATGDVVFDNADTTTLPGFPKPVGDININMVGANGLLDKLVAMGMLPADQVMGARMMMGLFAVPGDAPDTLKSRIEFTEEGQILANGQRLK